ncbi:hypothetical protein [Maridesulfovibrio sp.]|uniref:hypothetical protein n=1 Tax=Maridesulfovibrio sp. TaxID=2795000 RepID=UPI0029CA3992|nr:hypothetical protein [Maridesulfovibrio sp.]
MSKSLLEQGLGDADDSEDTKSQDGADDSGSDTSEELDLNGDGEEDGNEDGNESGEDGGDPEAAPEGDAPKFMIPGEDATPEEMAEFFKAMGVPEDGAEYEYPESMAEMQDEISDEFRSVAKELNLNKEQFNGVCDWVAKKAEELGDLAEDTEVEIDRKEQAKLFKDQHGKKADKMAAAARDAALSIGGTELLVALGDAGNRVEVLNAFAEIAPLVNEGKFKGPKKNKSGVYTREELRTMQQDPRFGSNDPTKRDEAFVKKVREGYKNLTSQEG